MRLISAQSQLNYLLPARMLAIFCHGCTIIIARLLARAALEIVP